jgi:hypothetical protein
MTDWTRDMVEERIVEAADVLKQLPGLRNQGYFSTWPEIQRSRKELAGRMPKPMRRPPPSPPRSAGWRRRSPGTASSSATRRT